MMKLEEKNDKPEIDTTEWVYRISESESERGIFCPRCGEPIKMGAQIKDEQFIHATQISKILIPYKCPIDGIHEWEVDKNDIPEMVVCTISHMPFSFCGHDAYRVIDDEVRREEDASQS